MIDVKILAEYIARDWGEDATFESALDDDEVSSQTFTYKHEPMKMLIVYSGDTAHGPIYSLKTSKIVGDMSDGDISIRGEYVDIDELEYGIKLEKFTVKEFFCGEMDPFLIGVLLDFDKTQEITENPDGIVGKDITVKVNLLSNIRDWDVIAELKQFNKDYYYMDTNADVDELLNL